MAKPIVRHASYWHPKENLGVIVLKDASGKETSLRFKKEGAIEMLAIMQILQDPNPSYITDKGFIATDAIEPQTK